MALPS